jgi:hypothetical protein
MIITKLIGGLGNQMFQYAAGLELAKKWNVPLKIDVTHLNKNSNGVYTQRQLELSIFNLPINIANETEINLFQDSFLSKLLYRYLGIKNKYQVVNEIGQTFNSNFYNLSKNTYLNGFWQNQNYFKNSKNEVLNSFTFNQKIIDSCNEFEKQLLPNSVSLHVRRGDYVTLSSANQFHGLCSIEYYANTVNYIENKLNSNLNIYIFSDDVEWCKQNLNIKNCIYLKTTSAAQDLYLMSKCEHNIIANSSFSWWGAWLNQNNNKIIIAPKYWFNGVESENLGILPENWITF